MYKGQDPATAGLGGGAGGACAVGEPLDPVKPQAVVNQGTPQQSKAGPQGTGQGRSPQVLLGLALFHQITETVKVGLKLSDNNATHDGWFHQRR